MKTEELNLTIDELGILCRLYMDSKLSVLEEKELEYLLSQTSLTSPAVREVRSLMLIEESKLYSSKPAKTNKHVNWKLFSGIAASIAILVSVAFNLVSPRDSRQPGGQSTVYVAAYSNGVRMDGLEAVNATNIAMAKADSLMKYASLTEHNYMKKANDIISQTFNN